MLPSSGEGDALLRVRSVVVCGLFDLYDHDIALYLDDRVTIIHGPNGVGKTTILHLLASLFGGDLAQFTQVPFSTFVVTLDDGSTLEVAAEKRAHSKAVWKDQGLLFSGSELRVAYTPRGGERREEVVQAGGSSPHLLKYIELELPWLVPMDAASDWWLNERTGRRMSRDEVLARYGEALPAGLRHSRSAQLPEWFQDARHRVGIHLIEAQRLLRQRSGTRYRQGRSLVPTVGEYSADLLRRIKEALAEYAGRSQSLDQSFPQRLLQQPGESVPVQELKARMAELDQTRQRFVSLGLLDEPPQHPFDPSSLDKLEETQAAVLALYVIDTEAKLQVLEELARRIHVLLENINEKFINKHVRVDQQDGLVAEAVGGKRLQLSELSSGEQHEIVLLYDLLFNVRPNTLVLIDEPELSLHVVWQKRFLHDLLEIAKTADLDALVATHSPFIVGEREDLLVDLSATPS